MLLHTGTQTIETERLILRKFEYTDDAAMLKYWIADENIQFLYAEPVYSTKEEIKDLLDKYIGNYNRDDWYRWAIILKETGECIGQIAYFLVDSKNQFAEIEYCLGSLFHNKGLMTEAAKAVIQYGFETIGLHKVQISHNTSNDSSRRVIEKCGFISEGTLRHFFHENGQFFGRAYYSILQDEYEMAKVEP